MKLAGNTLGHELCEILGIPPKNIHALTIRVGCDELVNVTIERWIEDDEAERIKRVFSKDEFAKHVKVL